MTARPNVIDQLARAESLQDEDPRYILLDKLGQGGMGVVWLAEKLGPTGKPLRTVVLKTVLPFSNDPKEIAQRAQMFLTEMAVTAALEHRNIVRVTDWGTDLFGDTHFFEMERVKGLSVLDLLVRRGVPLDSDEKWGPLPPADIAWIGMQAAAGLHYAHTYARTGEGDDEIGGVAHRDISPDNIMVDVDGEVKVTDWGITKVLDAAGDASRTGVIAGKAKYMAPEQIRGQIDVRADVYSLGVTLTVALAGKDVFQSDSNSTWESIAMAVLHGERPSVAELAPEAPPALQALLESMMHVDREQRPRTAGELVERFKDVAVQLGGDLYSVQKAFAERVREHHKEGKRTKRAMQAAHANVPAQSTRRPISAATAPSPGHPSTGPQAVSAGGTQRLGAPQEPASQPYAPAAPAPTSGARPVLLAAIAAGLLAAVLLGAVLVFLLVRQSDGDHSAGTTERPQVTETAEATTPEPSGSPTPSPTPAVETIEPPTGTASEPTPATATPPPTPEEQTVENSSTDAPLEAQAPTEPHPRQRQHRRHSVTPPPQPRPLTPRPLTPRTPRTRPLGRQMGGSDRLGL
ncbi:MAG TPA: serine/threonine protein kinase [Polyangiaceae bacterium]|nr:serine/threonine protein kinase [Polyangiaceae bacterium]